MLNNHFREFIELLEKNEVKYLIVGGYAVGIYRFPRYTGDLDIFIALFLDLPTPIFLRLIKILKIHKYQILLYLYREKHMNFSLKILNINTIKLSLMKYIRLRMYILMELKIIMVKIFVIFYFTLRIVKLFVCLLH